MRSALKKLNLPALAIVGAAVSFPAQSNDLEKAVVLGIHSQKSSAAFEAKLGLPEGKAGNGRFAVVRLLRDRGAPAAYALVYVPAGLTIAKDDVVVLKPATVNLVTHPGMGIVSTVEQRVVSGP